MIKIALSVLIVAALAYYSMQLLVKLERKQLKPIFTFMAGKVQTIVVPSNFNALMMSK